MRYTVKKLSQFAGISIRTLHYYDEIGLLRPSFIHENGYRYYEEKELVQLQQILFFKELDFSLEKIKGIIHSANFDQLQALEEQKILLDLKMQRTEAIIRTLTMTIQSMKGGETMSNDDKYSAFSDPTYQKYKDEVEQRWANTDAYKTSKDRVGKMSKDDLEKVKAEAADITLKIANLMKEGFTADSTKVQEQIDRFYKQLHLFYDPNYEMFKNLGQMYVDDSRFTKTYENVGKGLATFMRDAMAIYADVHSK